MKKKFSKLMALGMVFVFSMALLSGANIVSAADKGSDDSGSDDRSSSSGIEDRVSDNSGRDGRISDDSGLDDRITGVDDNSMHKSARKVDLFLTIKGTLQNKIEVLSYSHGVTTAREAGSGLATGKRQHKPFIFVKELDKSTPLLMKAMIENDVLPEVVLTISESNAKEAFTITLKNARILSIDMSSGLNDRSATEQITMSYQKIEWSWGANNKVSDDWK